MPTPSSGPISLANVSTELGASSTSNRSLGESSTRTLAGVPSGAISLYNLYGKSNVTFSPDGGTISEGSNGGDPAVATITCSTTAVWSWGLSGNGSASISSGGSATSVNFFCYPTNPSNVEDPFGYNACTFTVTGVAGGVTRNFTVNLVANGGY